MSELKPCPFCGGKAELHSYRSWHRVSCVRCNAQADSKSYYDAAARAWNNRPHENKIKSDAVRNYEASLSSFPYTAEDYIKANKLEEG